MILFGLLKTLKIIKLISIIINKWTVEYCPLQINQSIFVDNLFMFDL